MHSWKSVSQKPRTAVFLDTMVGVITFDPTVDGGVSASYSGLGGGGAKVEICSCLRFGRAR